MFKYSIGNNSTLICSFPPCKPFPLLGSSLALAKLPPSPGSCARGSVAAFSCSSHHPVPQRRPRDEALHKVQSRSCCWGGVKEGMSLPSLPVAPSHRQRSPRSAVGRIKGLWGQSCPHIASSGCASTQVWRGSTFSPLTDWLNLFPASQKHMGPSEHHPAKAPTTSAFTSYSNIGRSSLPKF